MLLSNLTFQLPGIHLDCIYLYLKANWLAEQVEFSDNIMGHRFGIETISLQLPGRDCGVVTSQHDRRFLDGNQGYTHEDVRMFGSAAIVTQQGGGSTPSGSAGTFSCDVTCVGLVFTASIAEGRDVCEAAGCGSGAPFVGISTFGCSADVNSWGGDCCNVNLCSDVSSSS